MKSFGGRWRLPWWMVLLLLLGWAGVQAQCPKNSSDLYHLEEAFESGRFGEILQLETCIESLSAVVQTRRSARQADPGNALLSSEHLDRHGVEVFLHLFAKAAVATDQPKLAKKAMAELRLLNPRYAPDPNEDPHGMRVASDSIIPYSANLIGICGGPSWSLIQTGDLSPLYYGLDGGVANPFLPDYRNMTAYSFGFEWQHYFRYRHGFITGLTNFGPSFQIQQHSPATTFNNPVPVANTWQTRQKEHLRFLQLPLLYQYRVPILRTKSGRTNWLSFHAGGYGQLLLAVNSNYEITKWEQQDTLVERHDDETLSNEIKRRTRWSCGLQGGLTYQMETFGFSWYVRGSMQLGVTQMRKAGTDYQDSFLSTIWDAHIIDNDFKIHSANLTVGLLIPKGNRVKKLETK